MADSTPKKTKPDLDEKLNVADAHASVKEQGAAVSREKALGENGLEPIALPLILICGIIVLVGGATLGQGGGLLNYGELFKDGYVRKANPSGEEVVLPPIPIMEAFVKEGAKHYSKCAGCHGTNGAGGNGIPPLANSEWVTGDTQSLSQIIIHGLKGPIQVAGVTYNNNMPAMGQGLGEKELAALMTYIRNAWGNKGSLVTTEMAAAALEIAKEANGQMDVPTLESKHAKDLPGEPVSPDTMLDPETFEPVSEGPTA